MQSNKIDTLSLPSKAKAAAKWTACKVRQYFKLVRLSKIFCILFFNKWHILSKWQSQSISLSSQFKSLPQSQKSMQMQFLWGKNSYPLHSLLEKKIPNLRTSTAFYSPYLDRNWILGVILMKLLN